MRDHLGNPFSAGKAEFNRGVLLLDDCSGTFTWSPTGTGGDDVHEYLAAAAWVGEKGLHLKTRTTSAAANDLLIVRKWVGMPASGLCIVRARIATPDVAKVARMGVRIDKPNGDAPLYGYLLIDPVTAKAYYANAAGEETELAALNYGCGNEQWVEIELALDLRVDTYLWARWQGGEADLSSVALPAGVGEDPRGVKIGLYVKARGANPAAMYGDMIYVGEFLDL